MSLLIDALSVWEIGFRWAGYDPDKLWFRIPLAVRDNFRTIVQEIHEGHLDCMSLDMSKYYGNDPEEAKFYIRYWLDTIEECSYGRRYDKTFLLRAIIERQSFQLWAERRKIPLPEFWFPPGWGIEYEWPDDTPEEEIQEQAGGSVDERKNRIDKRHRIKMACQQVALSLWAINPTLSIKEIATGKEVQELAAGKEFELETVQEWIGEIDPRDPSKKRGRKRNNNSGSENSG